MRSNLKDLHKGVVRRNHRRKRRTNRATTFLVVLLFAATAAVTWQFARQRPLAGVSKRTNSASLAPTQLVPANSTEPFFLSSRAGRPAYPYSIIPGGVGSVEELREIAEHDPVVARHFEGFDYQHAQLITVSEKQSLYVAYRQGNEIYWTRKKIALHPGETLISDGKIVARTRCGNRVAVAPLGPPAPMEPVASDLDQPLFSNEMVTNSVDPQPEAYAALIPGAQPTIGNALQPASSHKGLLPLFFLPLVGIPGGGGSSPHPPLAVAPEPGTMLLLSSGLAGVYLKARKSRRKQ
jgi:hypothetical protein